MSDRDTEPATGTDEPTTDDDSRLVDDSGAADTGADDDPTATDGADETHEGRFGAGTAVGYLKWAGVAVLAVTALVALFGFYTGVSRAISVWVSSSYRPIVNAAFNLALLLAALGGIGLLLRRTD